MRKRKAKLKLIILDMRYIANYYSRKCEFDDTYEEYKGYLLDNLGFVVEQGLKSPPIMVFYVYN